MKNSHGNGDKDLPAPRIEPLAGEGPEQKGFHGRAPDQTPKKKAPSKPKHSVPAEYLSRRFLHHRKRLASDRRSWPKAKRQRNFRRGEAS